MDPTRRTILAGIAGLAGSLGLPGGIATASGRATAAAPAWLRPRFAAGAYQQIYDPSAGEPVPWYINDHTVIRGADGNWHLIGITAPSGSDYTKERQFAHATAPSLHGPWTKHPPALVFDPNYYGENRLWAPHVIRVGDLYYMFYTGGGNDWHQIALSVATSPDLWTWTRERADLPGRLQRPRPVRDVARPHLDHVLHRHQRRHDQRAVRGRVPDQPGPDELERPCESPTPTRRADPPRATPSPRSWSSITAGTTCSSARGVATAGPRCSSVTTRCTSSPRV